MAIFLCAVCAWWVVFQLRERVQQPEMCFAWAVVVVILAHAQLEWPLASLHFAIPTLLLMGLGEPALAQGMGHRVPVQPRLLALAGAVGLVLSVSMMLEFNELAVTGERAELERHTKAGISEETLMRLLALSDASRLRPYSEALLVSVRGPNSVEPSEEELRRHERVLILGADPRLIVRLVILNARAGHFDAAMRHAERMRVFQAAAFDSLATSVLDSIKDLGPEADPLRQYLRTRQN
jgi:hypothetical protein